jgi:hypothetical protein
MCLGDFVVNFVIWLHHSSLPSIPPAAPLLPTPAQPSQPMLPIVVFLGLLAVVSWLIEAEEEEVAGGILKLIFLSPVVSIFMALVVVLLGNKINNCLQQQINAHDNK